MLTDPLKRLRACADFPEGLWEALSHSEELLASSWPVLFHLGLLGSAPCHPSVAKRPPFSPEAFRAGAKVQSCVCVCFLHKHLSKHLSQRSHFCPPGGVLVPAARTRRVPHLAMRLTAAEWAPGSHHPHFTDEKGTQSGAVTQRRVTQLGEVHAGTQFWGH